MELRSYNEWKNLGYHVIKGSHSSVRNKDEIPLFSEEQVEMDSFIDSSSEDIPFLSELVSEYGIDIDLPNR